MNKNTIYMLDRVQRLGVTLEDSLALRRISMTLHRWHELECGTEHGCITRGAATGKAYWLNENTGKRYRIADRKTGALKRLAVLMARYPDLAAYVHTDPRGAALYLCRQDALRGMDIKSCYSSIGVAIYK